MMMMMMMAFCSADIVSQTPVFVFGVIVLHKASSRGYWAKLMPECFG